MTDADVHRTDSEEPPVELEHVTIENDDAPDECAIFPRHASGSVLTTTWITAHEEGFVDLEAMR